MGFLQVLPLTQATNTRVYYVRAVSLVADIEVFLYSALKSLVKFELSNIQPLMNDSCSTFKLVSIAENIPTNAKNIFIVGYFIKTT